MEFLNRNGPLGQLKMLAPPRACVGPLTIDVHRAYYGWTLLHDSLKSG